MHKRNVVLALVAVLCLGSASNALAVGEPLDPLDPRYTVQRDAGDQTGFFGSWRVLMYFFTGF